MNIACLGWGSLIWKPGPLPVAGAWRQDGPLLPVEFSRMSDGGELATAICLNAPRVQVFWAQLALNSQEEAILALREREAIPPERKDGTGLLLIHHEGAGELASWARERNINALIWTALPPRVGHNEGQIPTAEQAVAYLDSLQGEVREHARAYVEQVPAQLETPYRRVIRERLGWDKA